jgi:hypothetical protein
MELMLEGGGLATRTAYRRGFYLMTAVEPCSARPDGGQFPIAFPDPIGAL